MLSNEIRTTAASAPKLMNNLLMSRPITYFLDSNYKRATHDGVSHVPIGKRFFGDFYDNTL